MWLRLGDNEIINLEHVVSVKKGLQHTIDVTFDDFQNQRVLPFSDKESRDEAFEKLVGNLMKTRNAMD